MVLGQARLLQVLKGDYNLSEDNALLTDRTFLVKAVSVMKARAILAGRLSCTPEDLVAMRYLTTFRVPEHVQDQIDQIIADILAELPPPPPPPDSGNGDQDGADAPENGDEGNTPDGGEPKAATWQGEDQVCPLRPVQCIGNAFACSAHVALLPRVPGLHFKPHSVWGIGQCHGLWADDDASAENDGNDELMCTRCQHECRTQCVNESCRLEIVEGC